MSTARRWSVEILIDESDGRTRAVARLDTSEDVHVHGRGTWCGPEDLDDAEARGAAADLAVASALREVASRLSVKAAVGAPAGVCAQA